MLVHLKKSVLRLTKDIFFFTISSSCNILSSKKKKLPYVLKDIIIQAVKFFFCLHCFVFTVKHVREREREIESYFVLVAVPYVSKFSENNSINITVVYTIIHICCTSFTQNRSCCAIPNSQIPMTWSFILLNVQVWPVQLPATLASSRHSARWFLVFICKIIYI